MHLAIAPAAAVAFLYLTIVHYSSEIARVGLWAADAVGHLGVFGYVYLVDSLIVPLSADILFPFVLNWSPFALLTVMSTASVAGGVTGYAIGRNLTRLPTVSKTAALLRPRHIALVDRYGIWGIALSALFPVPFSTISWAAGAIRLPLSAYVSGALFRVPRMIITYWLLLEGAAWLS